MSRLVGLLQKQDGLPRRGKGKLTLWLAQGLGQCVGYLARRYPGAQIIPVNSTAKAAQEAAEDEESLAICSIKCAEVYGLEVVDTDIQDGGESESRSFLVRSDRFG